MWPVELVLAVYALFELRQPFEFSIAGEEQVYELGQIHTVV